MQNLNVRLLRTFTMTYIECSISCSTSSQCTCTFKMFFIVQSTDDLNCPLASCSIPPAMRPHLHGLLSHSSVASWVPPASAIAGRPFCLGLSYKRSLWYIARNWLARGDVYSIKSNVFCPTCRHVHTMTVLPNESMFLRPTLRSKTARDSPSTMT